MIKNKVIKTIISVETNANFNLKKKEINYGGKGEERREEREKEA